MIYSNGDSFIQRTVFLLPTKMLTSRGIWKQDFNNTLHVGHLDSDAETT